MAILGIYGHLWVYIGIYGYIWVYMSIGVSCNIGYIWAYMDIYGWPWGTSASTARGSSGAVIMSTWSRMWRNQPGRPRRRGAWRTDAVAAETFYMDGRGQNFTRGKFVFADFDILYFVDRYFLMWITLFLIKNMKSIKCIMYIVYEMCLST